jgi:hypothetical protein
MGEKRHADAETINHIIDLRRRLAEAERQRDNALDHVTRLNQERREIGKLLNIEKDQERNC